MTVFSSWRKGRRAAAALGVVSAGLLTLSACEKPTPLATVSVGKDTVTAEAACYDDGGTLGDLSGKDKKGETELQKCLSATPKKTITVHPGDKVRLGVEPDMAEQGWFALSGGSRISNLSKQTYASFDGESLFFNQQTQSMAKSTTVTIMTSKDNSYTGVWNIKLERAES
ncbi:hypothetical protein [Streptomyces sp. NPDC003077]|uniref:hypothetical protein n=1 Tax=Streptomyces sp. NPDC003077 TaxID=3154443 RepID=UPI0033AF8F82